MRIWISFFLLLALLVAEAWAVEPSQQFRSFISGTSCEQLVNSLNNKDSQKEIVIMVGSFVSGVNYVKSRDSMIDLRGMLMLAEQYCRQNPQQPAINALIYLDKAIDNRKKVEQKKVNPPN